MQEAVKAPSSPVEAIERIRKHSLIYLNEDGPNREAEDIELGQRFNLDITKVKSLWAKARKERAEREGLTEVRLEDLSKPEPEPTAGPKPEPEPEEEPRKAAIAAMKARLNKAAQPKPKEPELPEEEPRKVEPKEEPKKAEEPKAESVIVDTKAPYEVARRFLVDRYRLDGALTLRLHRGDWRRWTGTHYAVMEDDALRAEVYDFLSKVNYEKFDPEPKHVNAVLDGVKVTCSPTCPRL